MTPYQTIVQAISNKHTNQPHYAWQLLQTLWNRLRKTLWWNKTPLCAQWLGHPNRHAFWQWNTAHRDFRMQSLRKCIQTKQGASQTTGNHKPNKAISWNEQLGKPSEKAMAAWWQNTKASRHWKVSTFGQKPRHRLTMQ